MSIKKGSIIVLLSLSNLIGFSQNYPHEYPLYPFIDYSLNNMMFPGDSTSFYPVFEKLQEIIYEGNGKLDVLHMGGSHIQAGVFSGVMRKHFQSILPGINSYRGFLFPYRIARTNNPSNYGIRYWGDWDGCRSVQRKRGCLLGLSGMSVTTQDLGAGFKVILDENYMDYDISWIRVFTNSDSTSYELVPNDSIISSHTNIELGYTEYQVYDVGKEISFNIKKTEGNQTNLTLYGIEFGNDLPGIAYHAVGVNGADVPSYNRCDLLSNHIQAVQPDVVVFSIGINDAYTTNFNATNFKSNYGELIETIREVLPDIQIIFTSNNDSYYRGRYANKNGEKVRKAMIEMAEAYNAGFWDMYGVMGGLNSVTTWRDNGLVKRDLIHFTRAGYTLIGNLFFSAFIKSFEDYLKLSENN